jgi:hypothetical protein
VRIGEIIGQVILFDAVTPLGFVVRVSEERWIPGVEV